jgi:uncharacterized Tic20 family protein
MLECISNNMKRLWRNFLILTAAVASGCSIGLMLHIVLNERIKTHGIETIQFKAPTIVSRFDLDDVTNRVPEAASKIEEGASRIVEEVSSKATAISDVLKNIPTRVTLGMDQVCWHASKSKCTPIWKGLDEWLPVPLEQFLKLDDRPVYLVLIKYSIRVGTTISLVSFLLAVSVFIGWLAASWWSTYGKRNASPQEKKKTPFRHGIIIVVVLGFFIVAPLIVNLLVLCVIDTVLGKITITGVTRTPGDLSKLLIFSLLLAVTSLVCLVCFHCAVTKITPPSPPRRP